METTGPGRCKGQRSGQHSLTREPFTALPCQCHSRTDAELSGSLEPRGTHQMLLLPEPPPNVGQSGFPGGSGKSAAEGGRSARARAAHKTVDWSAALRPCRGTEPAIVCDEMRAITCKVGQRPRGRPRQGRQQDRCQAGPLTHQLTQELHAGEAAGTELRVKRVCTAGGETAARSPQAGPRLCADKTQTQETRHLPAGKSRLADACVRCYRSYPQRSRVTGGNILKILLSLTSSNRCLPPTGQFWGFSLLGCCQKAQKPMP